MRPELVGPRRFFTVDVTNLLDLRVSEHRDAVALDRDEQVRVHARSLRRACGRYGLVAS